MNRFIVIGTLSLLVAVLRGGDDEWAIAAILAGLGIVNLAIGFRTRGETARRAAATKSDQHLEDKPLLHRSIIAGAVMFLMTSGILFLLTADILVAAVGATLVTAPFTIVGAITTRRREERD